MGSITKHLFRVCCLMLLLPAFGGSAKAAVLDVPTHYPTIQSAIDAAVVGLDSVRVLDGTYYENILLGKAISVTSKNGPATTIINGSNQTDPIHGSAVMINGAPATLSGFTLTGGKGTLDQNGGHCFGGGIFVNTNSTNNTAKIINCIITGNSAKEHGGGIWATGSVFISNSIIENNTADLEAGIGASGTVSISKCTIRNNTAAGNAGGIGFVCSSCEITDSVVSGNRTGADWGAGGIQVQGKVKIINTVISDNIAAAGGGIYVRYNSELSVTNSTIRNNSATYTEDPSVQGGGIFTYCSTPPTVVNTILWGNSPQQIQVYSSPITVRYSDVEGNWDGEGNFGEDPGFTGPMDYHLLEGSPCIDKGTNDLISYPTIPDSDIDGDDRPQGIGIDIGADEFVGAGPVPQITARSPKSGRGATVVTIQGTGFGASQGSSVVKFKGARATDYLSWSDTEIQCKVPKGAETGPVKVRTSAGTSNGMRFTVDRSPLVSSLSPTSGPVGTRVIIRGTEFGAEQGESVVKFKGVEASKIILWSKTKIKCKVPAGAKTGPVKVITNAGTSSGVRFDVIKGD